MNANKFAFRFLAKPSIVKNISLILIIGLLAPVPVMAQTMTANPTSDIVSPNTLAPTSDTAPSAPQIVVATLMDQNQTTETTASTQLKDSVDSSIKSTLPTTGSMVAQQQDPASIPKSVTKQLLPSTNHLSGALSYSFPIVVSPGRNALQPDLKINYNNQASEEGSVFGFGWSTNIPVIERMNRKGSEQLYSQNYFNSSLSGELVLVSGTTWAPKVEEGDFLNYTFSSNTWIVKDKRGITYKFGSSTSTRQDDPSDNTHIYRWMLEEVRDTNNNYVKYEYYKDGGQVYPSRIVYTGNGAIDGVFEINFLRQSRSDNAPSYKFGFLIASNYLINEINTKINGVLAHKYSFSYTSGANGARSILSSVVESGNNDSTTTTILPAHTLTYQSSGNIWNPNSSWVMPLKFTQSSTIQAPVQLADVNGDGLLDELYSGKEWDTSCNCFTQASHVWLNNGNGFTLDSSWIIPEPFLDAAWADAGTKIADINGDGLADILSTKYFLVSGNWQPDNKVYINNGSGWALDTSWVLPVPLQAWVGFAVDGGIRVFDVNGDGLPDIISAPYTGNTAVYLNNGNGWTQNTNWVMPARFMFNNTQLQATDMADVNGDGLMDVIFSGYEWNVGCNCFTQANHVWLNNSNGWTLDSSWSIPELLEDIGYNDVGTRLADVNGDGLTDILFSGYEWDTGSNSFVWHNRVNINNGHGWTYNSSWSIPTLFIFTRLCQTNELLPVSHS